MAREICRDARGRGAQVELGGRQRALHRNVLGARGHHLGQQREQGCGIADGDVREASKHGTNLFTSIYGLKGAAKLRPKGCNSFVAGTAVLMADGTRKAIEDVKIGDKVVATDPATGKTTTQPVTDTITGTGDKHLVQITIDTDGNHGHNTGVITATDHHPFWIPTLKRWLNASQLKPGMWLRTGSGTYIQITAVKAWTQYQRVYNLTVDRVHTYYVLSGSASALVHNCDPVYRVIRSDEDPSVGLSPKDPGANWSVDYHVRYGSHPEFRSQYISTTKKIDIARSWAARSGNRLVEIDLKRIESHKIIDLSTYQNRLYHLLDWKGRGYAMKSDEVLIVGEIPAEVVRMIS